MKIARIIELDVDQCRHYGFNNVSSSLYMLIMEDNKHFWSGFGYGYVKVGDQLHYRTNPHSIQDVVDNSLNTPWVKICKDYLAGLFETSTDDIMDQYHKIKAEIKIKDSECGCGAESANSPCPGLHEIWCKLHT